MQGILYEEPTVWLFLLVTVVMALTSGGIAATGNPVATCADAVLVRV